MTVKTWNRQYSDEDSFIVGGTGAFNTTLSAAAAVDAGGGNVNLKVASDIFAINSWLYFTNTTSYDGFRKIEAVPTGYLTVQETFTAETTATADTVRIVLTEPVAFELLGFELHVTVAPTTSENLTITKDAANGASFDTNIFTQDMSGVTSIIKVWDAPISCNANDLVVFGWTNTDTKTYGLEVKYRRLA